MPVESPFHPRTRELCRSYRWKDWAGYYAVCAYDTYPEREYFALRHAAGLIDVTPLYKYVVAGRDAAAFLAHLTVRDVTKLKPGRVTYLCWCDGAGKLLDDGTVSRLDDDRYLLTAAEPSRAWLDRNRRGYEIDIDDVTDRIAALSLQGPLARDVLGELTDVAARMRFFRAADTTLAGAPARVSRTGYTGDLGFEIWVNREDAVRVYDAVLTEGRKYGLLPVGLDAMDVARVEAGFLMNGVDYASANHCLIESRKSTPYEAALEWTVELERDPFVGQDALRREKERGPARCFAGLVVDWDETEALYRAVGLPPQVPSAAWRASIPIYRPDGRQVGYATSGAWSPTLKRNLALATLNAPHGAIGEKLKIEMTVEHVRHRVTAIVTEKPFFDPERKRATPAREEPAKGKEVAS
ncbi:MAG: aminomethyltransferase family protein [bacterium]